MLCSKCGKEIAKDRSFCDCCENNDNSDKVNTSNKNLEEIKKLIDQLKKIFEKISKDNYIISKFTEILKVEEDFVEKIWDAFSVFLSHQLCEIVIRNNTFSEEEKQILHAINKDLDLIEECKTIQNNLEFHKKYIASNKDDIGRQFLAWAHIVAVGSVFDKTGEYSSCLEFYNIIVNGSAFISPKHTQSAENFAKTNTLLFNSLFEKIYSAVMEKESGSFIPSEETKMTKKLIETNIEFLENYSEQFRNISDAIINHLIMFSCSMFNEVSEIRMEHYQILKYYFSEYLKHSVNLEFNPNNIIVCSKATSLLEEKIEGFSSDVYETVPDLFYSIKEIDEILTEQKFTYSFSAIIVLIYTRIHEDIVNANKSIDEEIVAKSEGFIEKIGAVLNLSKENESPSYEVDGVIELSCMDEDGYWEEYSGKLILDEDGILIDGNYSEPIFFESPPFFSYSLKQDTGEECILSFEANKFVFRDRSVITRFVLNNIEQYQIEQINEYCSLINNYKEKRYIEKIEVENKISEEISKKNHNELENFLYDSSCSVFSDFRELTLVIDTFISNDFFRKIKDCYEWHPEIMGKVITEFEFSESDFERADAFLMNFNMLRNYLIPIIDELNCENAFINYTYIAFKALFIVAVDCFHDYYISDLGYPVRDSIEQIACDLSLNEEMTYSDVMSAVFFCCKENLSTEHFAQINDKIEKYIAEFRSQRRQKNFNDSLKKRVPTKKISIDDIDLMTGNEFEMFIAGLFENKGYLTTITKATGDQGIDVIAEKDNTKIGIQLKCYSGTVGNSAIQEAVAGKAFYLCNKVMVITNSSFTSSAIELAKANDVVLWDREILKEKI